MKASILLISLLIYNTLRCIGQDTLVTRISRLESNNSSIIYDVKVRNVTGEPVCILHSVFIDLNAGVPQSIVPYNSNKTEEFFGLSYSAKDTTMVFERTLYDGELLMPHQVLNFKVAVPKTEKKKILYYEFIVFPDFCYGKIKEEMKKTATWYNSYVRSKVDVSLPN
jgi:hypothetical protein